MYHERRSSLPGLLAWVARPEDWSRVLPDGCIDVVWDGVAVSVAGPDTIAKLVPRPPGGSYAGLRFPPGVGPFVLRHSALELRDRSVALDDLWGDASLEPWIEPLSTASDPSVVLERMIASQYAAQRDPDLPLLRAVRDLRAGNPVATVASRVGLSERQLHRRALHAFGYGPKALSRILRLQRALALARRGDALAGVAEASGYSDQAHLARDVRALTGTTLTRLLA